MPRSNDRGGGKQAEKGPKASCDPKPQPPAFDLWTGDPILNQIRSELPKDNKTLLSRENRSKGDSVQLVQEALLVWGCERQGRNVLPKSGADGRFGTETKLAVIDFQKDQSLNPDGIVGPLTLAALENVVLKATAGVPVTTGPTLVSQPRPGAPEPTDGCPKPDPRVFDVEEQGPRTFRFAIVEQDSSGEGPRLFSRAPSAQFRWTASVKLNQASPDCFDAGFLQTVSRSTVFALYENAGGNHRACSVDLPTPNRDGPKGVPDAWFSGPGQLGTQCPVPANVPPVLIPQNTSTSVVMQDNPGGPFCEFLHASGTKCTVDKPDVFRLRQVSEVLVFDAWLAVRKTGAQPFNAACYSFLRHARWSVNQTIHVTHQGGVGALRKGGADLLEHGEGKGSRTPSMDTTPANAAVKPIACIP